MLGSCAREGTEPEVFAKKNVAFDKTCAGCCLFEQINGRSWSTLFPLEPEVRWNALQQGLSTNFPRVSIPALPKVFVPVRD